MPAHVPFALVQAIRAMRDTPHGVVPLIAITAFASANDSQAVLASGFDAHVSKPVDPERLASVIGRARASKRSTWGAR